MAGASYIQEDGALEDCVLSVLLNPIRDLTENWEINLSRYLQDYHDLLVENSLNAQEILSAINFAKAALVIQKSADIYGKKVDYLWQILHNVLDTIRNQRNETDTAKPGGTTKKGKEGKDSAHVSTEFCSLDDEFGASAGDINIQARETRTKVKLLPVYNPQLDSFLSVKKIELYGQRGNAVGNKYDFRVNKYLSSTGLLISEPELQVNQCLDMLEFDYEELPSPAPEPAVEHHSVPMDIDPEPVENCTIEVVAQAAAPTREEIVDVVADQDHEKDKAENSRKKSTVEAVNENRTGWDSIVQKDERERELQPRPTVHMPSATEYISSVLQKRQPADNNTGMERNKKPPSFLSFFAKDIISKGKKKVCYLAFQEYCCLPEQKRSKESVELNLDDVMRDVASEFGEEDFCGFEEPVILENEDDVNFEVNEVDELPLLECLPPPTDVPAPSYAEFVREAIVVPAVTAEVAESITQIVNEWHDSIRHILKASQERGHFNIHKYCDLVLSRFPYTEEHPVLPFRDIVGNEPVENVSRYFLATLMLANAYNVEIIRTVDDPLAMDCMSAKLLTRVRDNELLKEMYE